MRGWKRVERRQKPTKPKSTKVKLVIRGVDNGRRTIDEIKAELNQRSNYSSDSGKVFQMGILYPEAATQSWAPLRRPNPRCAQ
jgi:hypothetical protein